jgi:hypothetical protein
MRNVGGSVRFHQLAPDHEKYRRDTECARAYRKGRAFGARRKSLYAPSANGPHLHGLVVRITRSVTPMPTRNGPMPMTCV